MQPSYSPIGGLCPLAGSSARAQCWGLHLMPFASSVLLFPSLWDALPFPLSAAVYPTSSSHQG